MKINQITILLLSSALFYSCECATPEVILQKRIQKVIKLMEQKDYEVFLVNYYEPAKVEELKERHDIKKLAKYFGEGPQKDYLLNYLKSVQNQSPRFNEAKTTARFVADDFPSELVWHEVEGNWYLKN